MDAALHTADAGSAVSAFCRSEITVTAIAGTGVRLVWSKSVEDPEMAGIYGVFDRDLEHCPNCGDEFKIIAAILEQAGIEKILTHLGLQAQAPARGRALQAA